MINLDEGSLICDFAETYSVFNYRALPLSLAGTLASGLRPNSRIMMKIAEMEHPIETLMIASCLDELKFLAWTKTEDAQHGQNRPKSVLNSILNREAVRDNETFDDAQAFERARQSIMERIECQI